MGRLAERKLADRRGLCQAEVKMHPEDKGEAVEGFSGEVGRDVFPSGSFSPFCPAVECVHS